VAIEVREVSTEQRDIILSTQENHFADLKAIEIEPGKLTRTIAAFANADGGELYVGIDENKSTGARAWRGFADPEAANGHVQPFEKLFPLSNDFDYTFLECTDSPGLVLQVQVRKSAGVKAAADGKVYLRRGAQNLPIVEPAALKRLEYEKGLSSFETELVNVDERLVTNSEPVIEFMLNVVPTAEPKTWLAKQQLLRDDRPTVAGVILFAEEPQALVPKHCGIKVYRYTTKDSEGSRDTLAFDPLTIEGHAYAQVLEAVAQTAEVVQDTRKLGADGLENVQYPHETLHEIITNAVLHRDYSIADDIHIRVFDNRIEVESPGRLPAHITVENILDERFARNGNIVRLINKFPDPPNKDVGEGLNTAFAAMAKLGLKPPTIEERGNGVLITIKHETLASPEQVILEYLEGNESIRNKVAREITHIGADYRIKSIFGRLEERELIERVPGTDRSTTAYRQGPKFSAWRTEAAEDLEGPA
jgi:ATP-dependent DNA helicase RecG